MCQWIIALSLIGQTMSWAAEYGVGQKDFIFQDEARGRKLSTHVWYPIDSKIALVPIDHGSPFISVVVARNAPLPNTPIKFPVVLLSHGSGGKANKLFWLTDYFVRNGIVVIGVDHPGNMTGDNSADGMMRVWDRPSDLSFALDRLIEHKEFKSRLDIAKVGAAGHSAGGTTSLLLAGARISSDRLTSPIPNCAGAKDPYFVKICEDLRKIDFKSYSKRNVEADCSDSRVRAVVAFDPGMVRLFDPGSFKRLTVNSLLFIADKLYSPQEEIFSKEFAHYLPEDAVKIVPNSFHMTFLQGCKSDYPKYDPELVEFCAESEQKLRIQKEVAASSLKFFNQNWNEAKPAARPSLLTTSDN
jgi:predicted dienelactone hydrolase